MTNSCSFMPNSVATFALGVVLNLVRTNRRIVNDMKTLKINIKIVYQTKAYSNVLKTRLSKYGCHGDIEFNEILSNQTKIFSGEDFKEIGGPR